MGPNMATDQQEVDVLENWEDIDETDVLEKKFKSIITPTLDNRSNGLVKITLTGEDALRTQYVPPEPTVKILKRMPNHVQSNNGIKSVQPKKTLQQREQEYAKARLRILGETERVEEKISIQPKPRTSNDTENILRTPKGPDGTKGFNTRR